FARSSNVAFAKLADQYYHEQPMKFINHLHALRLDTATGIDITAPTGFPVIKRPGSKTWSATTIPFMAHGYEELVTPLQMLMLYNAVANNGRMMQPYLVNSIRDHGVDVKTIQPTVLVEKICSDQTLAQLKECLKAVVDSVHGTAHKIKDTAYGISGKTGTAVTALNNKGYNKGNKIYQASFIGFFPDNAPKYTIAVVIQNSKESKLIYGADVSGTVFKDISDKIYGRYLSSNKMVTVGKADSTLYNYYGRKNDWNSIFSLMNLSWADSAVGSNWCALGMRNNTRVLNTPLVSMSTSGFVTPNVVGMGLKDAVFLLESKGMKVTVSGRGRVMNQSIAAGAKFNRSQTISLILN
ncbi:MAG TPA: penicillin-binding transpeptidase domain-containing protein, partial [Ferruginibacter sp.]|nr:penicillin-binding transpeptidase domain-containing protein [Ferruginibacter sp.]